jgi:hypothetical protein
MGWKGTCVAGGTSSLRGATRRGNLKGNIDMFSEIAAHAFSLWSTRLAMTTIFEPRNQAA